MEVTHFPSPRHQRRARRARSVHDLRGAVFEGREADALAHEDARSPHPRRIAGDDFSERLFYASATGSKAAERVLRSNHLIYVGGIAE